MSENHEDPQVVPKSKKPNHIRQRRIVFGTAVAGLATTIGLGLANNDHHPDSLPTNEPIVQTINENIKIYPREFNDNVREWENRVNGFLMAGNEIEVQKIDINVKSGSEPVRLRSIPEFDLSSGEPQSHVQAELLPGFQKSFYGFEVEGDSTDAPNDNKWFAIFLDAPTKGEAPILAFLNRSEFTEESVHSSGNPMKVRLVGLDTGGFPSGVDADENGIRIGYFALPSAPKPPVY
ncbi:MAG: hypothetical protein Q8P20_10455 [bacterium]|nr:hypothetical protein [bacterium]